jgi:hypothetical protein
MTLQYPRFAAHLHFLALVATGLAASGCGTDTTTSGSGSVSVLLESEDVIVDGLSAGDTGAAIADGWNVVFDRYLATVGEIDLSLATDETETEGNFDSFVVDMTRVPNAGLPLWSLSTVPAGRWNFGFSTPGAAHGATRHDTVSEDTYETMVREDWTYFIEGELTNNAGLSCPPRSLATPGARMAMGESGGNPCYPAARVGFAFGIRAETEFSQCQIDNAPGFAVVANGNQSVAITLHGDHLFFNGFPEGGEGGVVRRAQFLADSDLNLDGTVTLEELEAIDVEQLPALDPSRYEFGGAPDEFTTVAEYVSVQLKTQGHFNGEGECLVDGVEHDHADESDP